MSKVEEDEETLPQSPKLSEGEKIPQIHTPKIDFPLLDCSTDFFNNLEERLKEKDRELLELAEYKRVEVFIDEDEKRRMKEMESEYAVLKKQVAEISAMRAQMEQMKREMREKDEKVSRIEKENIDIASNSAGLEIQIEQLKQKMVNREKELLTVIEKSGGNGLNGIKESLAKMKMENDQLKMEIEQEKFARSDENSRNEKMISSLRDEINHSEKARHETEAKLREQIRALEINENSEIISTMQHDLNNLRDTILVLEKTISELEMEKKELSMRITEIPSVSNASNVTARDISVNDKDLSVQPMDETLVAENTLQLSGDNLSLMDIDQTILCTLVSNTKSDGYSQKNLTVILELLKTEKKQLLDEIDQLQSQLTDSIQENEKLSSQVLESAQENDALKEKYEKMLIEETYKTCRHQANYDRMSNAYGKLEDELRETEASVKILQSEKDRLLEEKESTNGQWCRQKVELEKKVTFHADKAARCEMKIMELNKQISKLVLDSEDMKEKLEVSQMQLTGNIDLNTNFNNLMQKYKVVQMENTQNSSRIEDLQERNEKLKLQVDALLFETESLREHVSSDYCIIEEKDNHIDQLKKDLDEQRTLVAALEDKMKNIKPKLIKDYTAISDLEKDHKAELDKITESYNNALDKLIEEKKVLEKDNSKAKEMIELVKKDNDSQLLAHKEKLNQLHDKLFENNGKLDDLMNENTNLKKTLVDSRENIRIIWDLRQQLAEYRETQAELSQERNGLKSRVEEVTKQCIQLENEKVTLLKELESAKEKFDGILSEKLHDSNVEIKQLHKKLQCSEDQVHMLTRRVNKLELEECEMIKSIKNSHEIQVKEIKCDAEEKQQQLQDEKDQLCRINNQLETVIEDLKSVLEAVREDSIKSEKDLQNERESKEKLEKELKEIRQKHEAEIVTIKTDITENAKCKAEMTKLKGILATKNMDFEKLSFNYDNVMQKFNELERQNELNLSEIESMRQNISHLSDVAGEKDREIDELRLKLKQQTVEIDGLTDKLAKSSETKFNDLREQLQVLQDENDNFKKEMISLKTLADYRKEEINELQMKLVEKVMNITTMEEKLNKEKTQISSNDAILAELKKDNDEIVKEYKTMKRNYEKKIKSLKDANDFIATQRDNFKSKLNDWEDVIGAKEKEIDLLKGCLRKKEKSIEKLNGLVKEKITEINELKVNKKFDCIAGKTSSPPRIENVQKEKRRSDRQSLYDINRSIEFHLERDVGTMTDPSSDSCQCQYLSEKIVNLRKEIIVLEFKLSDTARNMEKNSLKNDLQLLQLEIGKKDQAIRTMSDDLVRRQKELSTKEAEMKRIQVVVNSPTILHKAIQTEQPDAARCGTLDSGMILRAELEVTRKQLESLQHKYEKMQDEWQTKSDSAERLMKERLTKYNQLKIAFFKLKQKYGDD